jgi:serine/threonine protein kinase
MGRKEVLKVVGGRGGRRPAILERFLREIRSAARLHHPNIVTAYSALQLGESYVLAMEYVEGLDLARIVKTKGPLPVAKACNYVHQAAMGLQHAHEHGMVHRDIKPANLILAPSGNKAIIKVLDFGLAKVTSEGQRDSGLTREGQMLGTPDYIAPEQIRDAQSADIRADIYSLGCTLYYLLSGGPPFKGDHLWDVYQAHFSMDASPLNLVRPEVPVELAAVVSKMMAKEPGRRFQQPRDVAQALTPFFKPGTAGPVVAKPDVSRVSFPEGEPRSTATPEPTRPAARTVPSSVPSDHRPARTEPASIFKDLIDLGEPEPLRDTLLDMPSPAEATTPVVPTSPARMAAVNWLKGTRPPRWWAAAGVLLLGLVITWAAGVLKVKTPNGVIVLEGVPPDAIVEVDGERITVIPSEGEPIKIEKGAGKHSVIVKRGRDVLVGEHVSLESGGLYKIAVRHEPTVAAAPTTDDKPAIPRQTGATPAGGEPGARFGPTGTTPSRPTLADPSPFADRTRFTSHSGRWQVDRNELVQADASRRYSAIYQRRTGSSLERKTTLGVRVDRCFLFS